MRSFLLEYVKRDDSLQENTSIDIHINLWGINAQNAEHSPSMVLDFGFMIDDITNISEIILYCPFQIEGIDDLGGLLAKKPDLIEAVFNEDCEVLSKIHPNRTKITKRGDNFKSSNTNNKEFILYKLDKSLIEFTAQEEYGKIKINVTNILSGNERNLKSLSNIKRYYFRVRIYPNQKEKIDILKRENEKINLLQDSSLRTTEIIDFRINDFRSITENIKEEVFRLNTFNIQNIHYLIMRNSTDEFISGSDKYKSRLLEREVWKDYFKLEDDNDVIAYHFKKSYKQLNENSNNSLPTFFFKANSNEKHENKEYISSFTNLSRFKYPLNVKARIMRYVFAIVAISIMSNVLYDGIKLVINFLS